MKKILSIIALACLFSVQGCDKFLNLKPKDIKVVSTVEDYRDMLASYMRLLKNPSGPQELVLGNYFCYPLFNIASDVVYRTGELVLNKEDDNNYDITIGEYLPDAVNEMTWLEPANDAWSRYYTFLGPINLILGNIDAAEGNDERLRDYVKGEALVWRAYSYFKLLQYYSPYKLNEYGIPMYLKPYEDPGNAMPERKTQKEVYAQIFSDCKEIFNLMERTAPTSWNYAYNEQFMNAMLASIYCYKALGAAAEDNDWETALAYAEEALKGRTFTRNPEVFKAMFDIENAQEFICDEFNLRILDTDDQVINTARTYFQYGSPTTANPGPDPDFYAMYKDDDVRKSVYFKTQSDNVVIFDKYNCSNLTSSKLYGGVLMLFRTAEMQLIKAEALCRLGREGEAREALNLFKQGRYLEVENSYTESDLLEEILKERKLEFYHEQDMWWLDMKRLGTRVERVVNSTLYVLEPDDWRYAFPIPSSEMERNKNMVQNPGWDEVNI